MKSKTQDIPVGRENEQFRITVHIHDTEPINFPIRRSEERMFRMAEYHVNKLCKEWTDNHPRKSSADILARVALAFAELYYRKTDQLNQQVKLIDDFEHELDRLINRLSD